VLYQIELYLKTDQNAHLNLGTQRLIEV